MFSLPNLKPAGKFKLPSRDGRKIRKAGVISFRSKSGMYCAEFLVQFVIYFCHFSYLYVY